MEGTERVKASALKVGDRAHVSIERLSAFRKITSAFPTVIDGRNRICLEFEGGRSTVTYDPGFLFLREVKEN